jgi:hypothetical protein
MNDWYSNKQQYLILLVSNFINSKLTEFHEILKPLDSKILVYDTDSDLVIRLKTIFDYGNNFIGENLDPFETETISEQLITLAQQDPFLDVDTPIRLSLRRNSNGFVYVFKNAAFQDLVKIGYTNLKVEHRAVQLFSTGVPRVYETSESWKSKKARALEQLIHKLFNRIRDNHLREFFKIEGSIQIMEECIEKVYLIVNDTFQNEFGSLNLFN